MQFSLADDLVALCSRLTDTWLLKSFDRFSVGGTLYTEITVVNMYLHSGGTATIGLTEEISQRQHSQGPTENLSLKIQGMNALCRGEKQCR